MKKVLSIICALATMCAVHAANTEVARLTLTGQGSNASSYITLRVDPTVMSAETSSYFQNTELTENVNIYIAVGSDKYSSYKLNEIKNLPIAIVTNRQAAADQHYTITFNVPTINEGFKITDLRDNNRTVNITNGGTFEFDVNATTDPEYVAGTNYVVANRFVINYERHADSGELEICHKDNKLELLNNPYTENIVVKDAEGNKVKDVPSTNTPQYIDLSDLPAGQYTVELNDGNRKFVIKQ